MALPANWGSGHTAPLLRAREAPDNAAAFRALVKIGKLEVIKTETFPIEKVDVFIKTLV